MSVRIETIGDATLYCGDCREILPEISVADHVISDPPYEDELHKAVGRIARTDGQKVNTDLKFAGVNEDRPLFTRLMVERSSGWLVLFTLAEGVRAWRDELQSCKAKYDTCLFWIKPDSMPRMNGQGPARGAECAVTAWSGKGYRKWNGGGKRGVYTHCVNKNRHGLHPTEKPVPLMIELVSDFTQQGQVVLDPFMGTGATGIACVRTGRRFTGIELDERYFEAACERIQAAHDQPGLFSKTPDAPKMVNAPLF